MTEIKLLSFLTFVIIISIVALIYYDDEGDRV